MGEEEAVPDQVVADQGVGLEDPADPHRRVAGLGEFDRHHRADRQVFGGRRGGVDEQLPGGECRSAGSGIHP